MGLNELYTGVRGSILMVNPLPTIADAFSILIQEEKQRKVKSSNHLSMDSAALNASGPVNNSFRTNYTQQGNNNINSGYRGNQFNNRPRLFHDYCKRPGHTKEKCYKLHEFSQNFKFNKGRRIVGNVLGSSSEGAAMKDDRNNSQGQEQGQTMHNLTKEQYRQLLSILESFQGGGDKSTNTTINGGAVNFAGSFTEEATGDWYGLYLHCSNNYNTGSTSPDSSSTSYPCLTSNKDEEDGKNDAGRKLELVCGDTAAKSGKNSSPSNVKRQQNSKNAAARLHIAKDLCPPDDHKEGELQTPVTAAPTLDISVVLSAGVNKNALLLFEKKKF